MKIISYNTRADGSTLEWFAPDLDTDFIKNLRFDTSERVITATYDVKECGNPLHTCFDVEDCEIIFKITRSNIYTDMVITPGDNFRCVECLNEALDLICHVDFAAAEKTKILSYIVYTLMCEVEKAEEADRQAETKNSSTKNITDKNNTTSASEQLKQDIKNIVAAIFNELE